MLIEKMTVNVGENNPIYIELHDMDTPVTELKYGDCRFDANGDAEIWYGEDENASMSGWQVTEWALKNVTGAILLNVREGKTPNNQFIYRIMNNDIDFDEAAYTAMPVGDNHE
jgi:hypothetical protein